MVRVILIVIVVVIDDGHGSNVHGYDAADTVIFRRHNEQPNVSSSRSKFSLAFSEITCSNAYASLTVSFTIAIDTVTIDVATS